jgi:hypothetical protein
VIPREGVESRLRSPGTFSKTNASVIPREGVERVLEENKGLANLRVIPREGVESP